jgi:hypothetical protein
MTPANNNPILWLCARPIYLARLALGQNRDGWGEGEISRGLEALSYLQQSARTTPAFPRKPDKEGAELSRPSRLNEEHMRDKQPWQP